MSWFAVLILTAIFPVSAFSQSWQAIAPMPTARMEAQCVQLNTGKILVAGGCNATQALNACELYDPLSNTWAKTGDLNIPRHVYEMRLLPDGRVIIIGGMTDMNVATTATSEIYDPATGLWTLAANMIEARENAQSCVMPDGSIMLFGGLDANVPAWLSRCERFNPSTLAFEELPDMPIACYGTAPYYCAPLNSIFVCSGVIGGFGGDYTPNVQTFDLGTQTWTAGSPLIDGHVDCEKQSCVTEDGSYILFGGRAQPNVTTERVEYLDLPTQTWKTAGSLIVPHWHAYAFSVGADSFLVVGGVRDPQSHSQVIDTTSWFNFATGKCELGPKMIDPRYFYTGLLVRDSNVEDPCREYATIYVFGGGTLGGQVLSRSEKLYLGSRPKPQLAEVTPSLLQLTSSPCSGTYDTSISIRTTNCSQIILDSIISYSPGSSVSTSVGLPHTLGIATSNLIPLHIDVASVGNVAIKLVFSTPAGKTDRYIYAKLSAGSGAVHPLSVDPIPSQLQICLTDSLSLKVRNLNCDTMQLDSIQVTSPGYSSFVPSTKQRSIAPSDSLELNVLLPQSLRGTYQGKIELFYHKGNLPETTTYPFSLTVAIPPAALSTTSISSVGTVCQAATATMMMRNPGCDSAVVDSVRFDGAGGARFVVAAPATLHSQDSSAIMITLPTDSAGVYASTAHVYYHIGPQHDTLSAGVIFTIGGASAGIAQAVINDITDARPGDTITVPLRIAGGNNTQATGFTLHAEYNTDLLQMLPPDFANTLSAGTPFQDINQTSRGANLFVPSMISINTGTLVNLRFITYLTDSECTEVHLRSLIFSPNDPKFTACVLSTNLDSAEICVHAACGDAAFRSLWSGQMPQLNSIQVSNGILTIDFSGAPSARLDLYDVMGRIADDVSHNLKPGVTSLDISSLPSGVHFARVVSGGTVLSRRVVISR